MDFSNLCKELGVASVGWNSDSYTFGVNEDSEGCVLNFKDFVENMGIVKIGEFDTRIVKEHFSDFGNPLYTRLLNNGDRLFDHMRIAMTREGKFILISQPYLSNDECKEKIIFLDFQNPTRVLGKDKSWYNIGNTNVVLFFEDRFKKQQ
jgi:hypothetical protein